MVPYATHRLETQLAASSQERRELGRESKESSVMRMERGPWSSWMVSRSKIQSGVVLSHCPLLPVHGLEVGQ
jgi:hypothetical protein